MLKHVNNNNLHIHQGYIMKCNFGSFSKQDIRSVHVFIFNENTYFKLPLICILFLHSLIHLKNFGMYGFFYSGAREILVLIKSGPGTCNPDSDPVHKIRTQTKYIKSGVDNRILSEVGVVVVVLYDSCIYNYLCNPCLSPLIL